MARAEITALCVALSNEAIKTLAKDGLMQRGQQLATQLASNVAQPLAEGNEQEIGLISRVALNQPDVRYVMVFDRQGRIVNAARFHQHGRTAHGRPACRCRVARATR